MALSRRRHAPPGRRLVAFRRLAGPPPSGRESSWAARRVVTNRRLAASQATVCDRSLRAWRVVATGDRVQWGGARWPGGPWRRRHAPPGRRLVAFRRLAGPPAAEWSRLVVGCTSCGQEPSAGGAAGDGLRPLAARPAGCCDRRPGAVGWGAAAGRRVAAPPRASRPSAGRVSSPSRPAAEWSRHVVGQRASGQEPSAGGAAGDGLRPLAARLAGCCDPRPGAVGWGAVAGRRVAAPPRASRPSAGRVSSPGARLPPSGHDSSWAARRVVTNRRLAAPQATVCDRSPRALRGVVTDRAPAGRLSEAARTAARRTSRPQVRAPAPVSGTRRPPGRPRPRSGSAADPGRRRRRAAA